MNTIKLILFLSLAIICFKDIQAQKSLPTQSSAEGRVSDREYTHSIFQNADKAYGYDIFNNGKCLIHQPTIPGRSRTKGFATQQNAESVAMLAIQKIKKGMMPPTIEENELKETNIKQE